MDEDSRASIAASLEYWLGDDLDRIVIALESIAQSLEKLAAPVSMFLDKDGEPKGGYLRVDTGQ